MSSKLAIGCAQFGFDYGVSNKQGQTTLEEVKKITDLARKLDIDTYDTAPSYGESELVLGQVLPTGANIITKTIHIPDDAIGARQVESIQKSFKQSLSRLGKNMIYGLLVHSADDLLKPGSDELYSWLKEKKIQALLKKLVFLSILQNRLIESWSNFRLTLSSYP